jgi:hypothetical protein
MKKKLFYIIAIIILLVSSTLWIIYDTGIFMLLIILSEIAILDEIRVWWQDKSYK